MPLSNGYGVVVGKLAGHKIEPPDEEGRWPHYQIFVDTPAGRYECVVNLKSRTEVKIEYRDFRNLQRRYFSPILELPDGLHRLESRPRSGALDVIRHPGLKDPRYILPLPWMVPHRKIPRSQKLSRGWIRRTCPCTRWWRESGLDLVQLMEYYLTSVARIYIFGEPYDTGLRCAQRAYDTRRSGGEPLRLRERHMAGRRASPGVHRSRASSLCPADQVRDPVTAYRRRRPSPVT